MDKLTRGLTSRITWPLTLSLNDTNTRPASPGLPAFLRGTNISGQDSGGSIYAFVTENVFDYFASKNTKAYRLTFRQERMQPTPGGALAEPYATRYEELVNFALDKGGYPIIDPHNFGRVVVGGTFDDYNNPTGGTEVIIGETGTYTAAHFADLWTKLSNRFSDPRISYNLMNEPHDQVTATLTATLNTTIAAIRAAGHRNRLIVPFNGYSNRHGFVSAQSAMATHLNGIVDSADNWVIDYHCYMDAFSAGTSVDVQANFMADVQTFTTWCRANGKKAFCGEFGAGVDAANLNGAREFFRHLEANDDVWVGWVWWTSVMYQDTYRYQLLPTELTDALNAGPGPYTDRIQMNLIEPVLADVDAAPTTLIAPTLTGTAKAGQVLGGNPAVVTGNPLPAKTITWLRDDVEISGATAATYTLTNDDVGHVIKRREVDANGVGSSATNDTAASDVVLGFDMLDVPNLAAWFKPDGYVAGTWTDASGNGFHGTQATPANQPTPAVSGGGATFTSVQKLLSPLSASEPNELAIIVGTIPVITGSNKTFMGANANNGRQIVAQSNASGVCNRQGVAAKYGLTGTIPAATKFMLTMKTVTSASERSMTGLNGNTANSTWVPDNNAFTAGRTSVIGGKDSGENFVGTIHEIVVVSGNPDFATIQKIEGKLAWRHGLESLLPVGHPYKNASP